MRHDYRRLFKNGEDTSFSLKGLRSASVKEPPVPIIVRNESVGKFHGIEVFERVSHQHGHPQTIADLVSNAYFRLTYQKPDGTSATFGTSVIGAPSIRIENGTFHLIPTVSEANVNLGDPDRLKVSLSGKFEDLACVTSVRKYENDAAIYRTTMQFEVTFMALQDISMNRFRLGNDVFRLFTISSMYSASHRYDGNLIRYKGREGTKTLDLRKVEGRGRYLFKTPQPTSEIDLVKEIGSMGSPNTPGSPDSPSINAKVISTSIPVNGLAVQAYLDASPDINDDSLSVWLEWTHCPPVIPEGQVISATIEFCASPPS